MKKILYIHGFCSSARSSTITTLQREWTDFEVHAFDVNHHPLESIAAIEDYVKRNNIDLLMGTSLGGYYVLASDVDIPKVAVNPVIKPESSLDRIDVLGTHEYFNPRADGVQTFEVKPEHLQEFVGIELHITPQTYIIGSTHDELLGDLTGVYRKLVGERFTSTSETGHRIDPVVTQRPHGVLYTTAIKAVGSDK